MRPLRHPQQYIDAVRQTGLVDAHRLKAFVADLKAVPGLTLGRVGELATHAGLLTRFQSREVMAGRADQLTFRHYRLIDKLGSGGMGDVYLGVHLGSGERRAIKILAATLMNDPVARQRLEREAQTAAALDHPNIVRVHEFDCHSRIHPPYLVMEYVDGVSLQAAVALTGTFDAAATAEYGRQVAGGLQHAWERRLVHRDVKPANLLLDRTGRIKVLDLGIVRLLEQAGLTQADQGAKQILGTLDYLAPEQALDSSAVDCRADVYSLGATLYFLLAGHPPFDDANPTRRLRRKHQEDPPPVHTLRPDVPEELSAVIARMLARSAAGRYPTPADAATALNPFAAVCELSRDRLFERLAGAHGNSGVRKGSSTAVGGRKVGSSEPRTAVLPSGAKLGSTAEMGTVATLGPENNCSWFGSKVHDTPAPSATARMIPARKVRASVPKSERNRRFVWVVISITLLILVFVAVVVLPRFITKTS